MLLILPIFALLMYFLMIRPQQRRMKEQQALISHLTEGVEVMLTSGIYGIITEVESDTVFLEVAEGIELKVAKGAVSKVIPEAQEPAVADEPSEDEPKDTGGKSKR